MKIVHCIYDHPANPWVGGGGGVRLYEIYRRLAGEVDVTLVTGRFPGVDALDGEAGLGVRHRALGAGGSYALSRLTYGVAATRLLARGAYDAAVFDFSAYTPIRTPAGRPVGLLLSQLIGPTAAVRWGRPAGAAIGWWERRQLGRAREVAAVSTSLLDSARPYLPAGARTCVVGAGVDESYFSVRREESDYILYYGRFDIFQKGLDVVVEATRLLLRDRPSLRLRIAGRGRDAGRIRAMVREAGLDRAVEIIVDPEPARTRALLAGALMLVMPSRFEGFGMVAVEAMAAGVPVVASQAGALPDVVGTEGGLLVPPDDPEATATAIASLLDDPGLRARLAGSARSRAGRHAWDRVAQDHLAWLRRIADPSASPALARIS